MRAAFGGIVVLMLRVAPATLIGLIRLITSAGCPANFYMSRRWAIEGSVLTIAATENQPLARLKVAGERFEGQSMSGTPLTLAR